ncbi:MAG TPA: hypothetical protein VLT33_12585, partial [Labilithrix sp.]|nr:hypothetical protein [Labilithrix sp.]
MSRRSALALTMAVTGLVVVACSRSADTAPAPAEAAESATATASVVEDAAAATSGAMLDASPDAAPLAISADPFGHARTA